jgi:fatty-acid desaturase
MGLVCGTSLLWIILGVESWFGHKSLATAIRDGLVFGSIAAGIHAVTFVFLLNPSVNALCHWPHKWLGGYQHSKAAHTFCTFNNWVVALLTAGEGFHNNHLKPLCVKNAIKRAPWLRSDTPY